MSLAPRLQCLAHLHEVVGSAHRSHCVQILRRASLAQDDTYANFLADKEPVIYSLRILQLCNIQMLNPVFVIDIPQRKNKYIVSLLSMLIKCSRYIHPPFNGDLP